VYIIYYNIATIEDGIFQPHKELLINLVLWIILYFFLLTIFSYMLYNFKWSESFQACEPTCLEEWIQRVTIILDIFSYWCDIVKCNYPGGCRAKIRIFVTSNANILQSSWRKFLKIFPHLLKLVEHKILWLHVS